MDGNSRTVMVDSATISGEVCVQICNNLGIKDTFGFSLFITLYDKVLSLGSSNEHILDAISQCEQFAKEQGETERNAPWRLFFRKEIFTPWYDPSEEMNSTDLIYHQIVRGFKFGEYRCTKDGDIAILAAMQYCVENEGKIEHLQKHLRKYIPDHYLKAGESVLGEWEKRIAHAFNTTIKPRNYSIGRIKEDVVSYGKTNWPILFSRFFQAIRVLESGNSKVVIAVNGTGVYIIDDQENILAEISFAEILRVECEKTNTVLYNLNITTVEEDFIFQTLEVDEVYNLINYLLDGLKKRSRYVVAIKDKESTTASTHLPIKKGDLIYLPDSTGEDLLSSPWGKGKCNKKQGIFSTEDIHILPVLSPPPEQILSLYLKDISINAKKPENATISTIQRVKYHTLANYAKDNFREGRKYIVARGALQSARKMSREELWRHTNEPIQAPLLKNLQENELLSKEACLAFMAILKYMGDLPVAKPKQSNEFTTQIFGKAMHYNELQDEIYCQIMRQLTYNRLQSSDDGGWELMWLACGLFVPSSGLLRELNEFLKSRTHLSAKQCIERVRKTEKIGPRRYSPYTIEVEAIKHRSLQIYHKIYFPDDTDEAFELNSLTKAEDLIGDVTKRLELKDSDGFSLFVMIDNKMFSMPDGYFFFDFIQELLMWIHKNRPSWNSAAPLQSNYHIFFMKKLWVNVLPGRDENSDEIFYYPQEVPKYLRGFHKCTKQEAIKLAALIYRSKYENDLSHFQTISEILPELVPSNMIKAQSVVDWKKTIFAAHATKLEMSILEAKQEFLKNIHQWPTFGSAFFTVKQNSQPNYPEVITIAINKNGVGIIHPLTKDILATHPFSELSNWSSGNTYFHMTFGNIMHASKLLCETSLGYKIDDLISSYSDYLGQRLGK